MFLKDKKDLFILGCLLFMLSGCGSYKCAIVSPFCPSYNASILSPLPETSAMRTSSNPHVLVSWKFFEKDDCKTYLGRNVLAKGYIPVQVTIRNYSKDSMYLEASHFNIPLLPVNEVASSVHASTIARVLGWGIPGLLLWPLLAQALCDGIQSPIVNASLDADYQSKAVNSHIIQPYTTFNGIVFIAEDSVSQPFEMFLINQNTHEKLIFHGRVNHS